MSRPNTIGASGDDSSLSIDAVALPLENPATPLHENSDLGPRVENDDQRPIESEIEKDERHVPSHLKLEFFDICILYAEEDRHQVVKFQTHLENEIKLPCGEMIKVILYDDARLEELSNTYFRQLDNLSERCTQIFMYITEIFCNKNLTRFSAETCLWQAITDEKYKGCCVPVLLHPYQSTPFKMPPSLQCLVGVKYYNNDQFYRENLAKRIERQRHIRLNRENLQKQKRLEWLNENQIERKKDAHTKHSKETICEIRQNTSIRHPEGEEEEEEEEENYTSPSTAQQTKTTLDPNAEPGNVNPVGNSSAFKDTRSFQGARPLLSNTADISDEMARMSMNNPNATELEPDIHQYRLQSLAFGKSGVKSEDLTTDGSRPGSKEPLKTTEQKWEEWQRMDAQSKHLTDGSRQGSKQPSKTTEKQWDESQKMDAQLQSLAFGKSGINSKHLTDESRPGGNQPSKKTLEQEWGQFQKMDAQQYATEIAQYQDELTKKNLEVEFLKANMRKREVTHIRADFVQIGKSNTIVSSHQLRNKQKSAKCGKQAVNPRVKSTKYGGKSYSTSKVTKPKQRDLSQTEVDRDLGATALSQYSESTDSSPDNGYMSLAEQQLEDH